MMPSAPMAPCSDDDVPEADQPNTVSGSVVLRLYVSHALSAWNSRLFEFGSTLFLTSIYPDTLMPVSVYALVRAASAILLSPAVGVWIDHEDRLVVAKVSIIGQRVAVALSCAIFLVLESNADGGASGSSALFTSIVILAGVEKLSAVMNAVSITRDWVVEMTEGDEVARTGMNAQIRQIDLFCKLLGPFLIASLDQISTVVAIWTTLAMTVTSVFAEYMFIERVYHLVPQLAQRVTKEAAVDESDGYAMVSQEESATDGDAPAPRARGSSPGVLSMLRQIFPWSSIVLYVQHKAFLPSLAYAFLHLTVLSFSGRMIAFLLAVGYTSLAVGVARTVSTVAELSATWISPRLMTRLGRVRSGSVSIVWEAAWLSFGVGCFVVGGDGKVALIGLVAGVILSRIGLWGVDLAVQNIVQNDVESDNRGSFSTAEASIQNIFELLSYVSTIVFYRPDQFIWPMVITLASVYAGCLTYAIYVRQLQG